MSDSTGPSRLRYRYIPNGLFVYAQLGRKPGAAHSLSMLPAVSDLPGDGWRLVDQRTWRTGRMGKQTDWSVRARKLGSVTAIRSFEHFEHREAPRWLMTQVIPLADAIDAGALLADLPARFMKSSAKVTVTGERPVPGITVPGCSSLWALEQQVMGTFGEGGNRLLAGTVGRVVLVIGASGPVVSWSWEEVISLATAMTRRISERNSNEDAP